MSVQKLEFKNHIVATIASGMLGGDIKYARVGSAVVVVVYDSFSINLVADVCHDYDGYFSNIVTDYDKQLVE